MPITKLDAKPALVVIDLQKGIVGMPTVHPAADIIERSSRLARAFRERDFAVVLVNVAGRAPGRTNTPSPASAFPPDWSELVPEVAQVPGTHRITKQRWGAFLGTALDEYLREHGITQIVLAGISTSIGVESTARSAYELGYNVAIVTDAVTDRDADAHRNSIEKIFPRLAEIDTTESVLKLLSGRS